MIFTLIDNGRSFHFPKMEEIVKSASVEFYFANQLGFRLIHQIMDEVPYRSGEQNNQLMMRKGIVSDMKTKNTLKTTICQIEDVTIITLDGRLDTVNVDEVIKSVNHFVGDAVQSDDVTMLTIHYKPNSKYDGKENSIQ